MSHPGRHATTPALRRAVAALGLCVALVLAAVGAQSAPAASAASGQAIAPEQQLVTLLSIKSVHGVPDMASRKLAAVADQRPITLVRTSLPVLAQKTDAEGRLWLRVRLPGRVFHRKTPPPSGWITASDTRMEMTAWHVVVDTHTKRVVVYRNGRQVRSFGAIVGKPSTPTPRGEYFVEEVVRLPSKFAGAPYALALSARSNVLQEFAGGPGQIALHGIDNVGGQIGTAESHGCVRLTTAGVTWLAQHIRAGVPLTIR